MAWRRVFRLLGVTVSSARYVTAEALIPEIASVEPLPSSEPLTAQSDRHSRTLGLVARSDSYRSWMDLGLRDDADEPTKRSGSFEADRPNLEAQVSVYRAGRPIEALCPDSPETALLLLAILRASGAATAEA